MRLSLADNPEAENPGALTKLELVANPDSAAANNIRRGADKDVQQQQLALGLRHVDAAGNEYGVNVFGLLRDLENPLAAPPPGPSSRPPAPTSRIDRAVGGARASGTRRSGAEATAPRLTAGADIQRMRDDRQNFVSDAGVPTDSVLIDQRETITEFGPFAQLQWSPREELLLNARRALRLGPVRRGRPPPERRGGQQRPADQRRPSGNIGASWTFGDQFVPYINVSTSFETPTTTELVNQPNPSAASTPSSPRSAR